MKPVIYLSILGLIPFFFSTKGWAIDQELVLKNINLSNDVVKATNTTSVPLTSNVHNFGGYGNHAGNKVIKQGDNCSIENGATIRVVSTDKKTATALVEYNRVPGGHDGSYGNGCSVGVQFQFKLAELEKLSTAKTPVAVAKVKKGASAPITTQPQSQGQAPCGASPI